ncbi:MAG: hypothetical protein NWR72_12405 [Bacteroidia bacterium]|nr:hypothetical protein [Bacteroidia bacterium]
MKTLLFLLPLLTLSLFGGCQECAFCKAETVTYENGVEVDRQEGPLVNYCDELLEELQSNPVDSVLVVDSISQKQQLLVTNNSCL